MRGSKTKLGDDHWRLRVYAGRDRKTGTILHVSENFRGGSREADAALRALVAKVERTRRPKHHTVADLLDHWLQQIEPTARPYTMQGYRRKVTGAIVPELGHIRVDRLTAEHLDRAYARWLAKGLSPTTVHQYHAILATALARAVKWEWLPASPALKASPPAAASPVATAPTVEQVREMIDTVEDDDPVLAAAIALAAFTGARRGELCALRWSDFDPATSTVTIARSLTVIGGTAEVGPTKTKQVRRLSLDPVGATVIAVRQDAQRWLAAQTGVDLVADPFLLSRMSDGSEPCKPDGISHGFARLTARLGMGFHFHQLRHFHASVAIAAGYDVRTVAGRLGHSDATTTLRIYAHVLEAKDQALAGMFGQALGRPPAAEIEVVPHSQQQQHAQGVPE